MFIKKDHEQGHGKIYQSDWQVAVNLRVCPPDSVLFGGQDEILQRHIKTCYMCRENISTEFKETWTWPDLSLKRQEDTRLNPGQIWKLSSELAGWGPKDRYYNPPEVLVLEILEDRAVKVAQVYPGDEFMTDDDIHIIDYGMAEPWNIYTLNQTDLEFFQGIASMDIVLQVLQKSEKYFEADEDSFLFLFRSMEIEVGSFFSQQSLGRLLDEMEGREISVDGQEILDMLEQSGLPLELTQEQDPFFQLAKTDFSDLQKVYPFDAGKSEPVARVRISSQPQAMAAADKANLRVNIFVLDEAGLEIRTGLVSVLNRSRCGNCLYISGKTGQDFPGFLECLAWWETPEKNVPASRIEFLDDSPLFEIRFDDISSDEHLRGKLVIIFFRARGF